MLSLTSLFSLYATSKLCDTLTRIGDRIGDRRCVESNQEKAEGNEWDSEEQTSKLPRRVQLAEMLPW